MDKQRSLMSDFGPIKTTLTPSHFIKGHVPSQESQRSCKKDIGFFDFPIEFLNWFECVVIFCFHFMNGHCTRQ